MLQANVEYNGSQAAKIDLGLAKLPRAVVDIARITMSQQLDEAQRYMTRRYLDGERTTRTRLAKRSGQLLRSFRGTTRVSGNVIEGHLFQIKGTGRGDPRVYGAVHEFGATIRPKKAQHLTIPLTEEARRTPARKFPGLFALRLHTGNLFLARKVGSQLKFEFLLVKEVVIPARPFFFPTVERLKKRLIPALERKVRQMIQVLAERGPVVFFRGR